MMTTQTRENGAVPRAAPHEASLASEVAFHEPDPIIGLITESSELVVSLIEEVRRSLELKIARLETRIAEIDGENKTLRVLVEQARAPGARGPRGVAGLRGERGEAGPPAAKIAAWSVSEIDFTAVPIYVGGELGPPLKLEPLLASLARALAAKEGRR